MNTPYGNAPLNMDGSSAPVRPPMRLSAGVQRDNAADELKQANPNAWYTQSFRLHHQLPLTGGLVTMSEAAHANMMSRAQEHDRLCGELVKVSVFVNSSFWFESANAVWPFASDKNLSCQDVAVRVMARYLEVVKTTPAPAPARPGVFARLALAFRALTHGTLGGV